MKDTIIAISGKPGLFRIVSQGRNMIIVESVSPEKKRTTAGVRDRVTSLNDISMYTDDEDKPLMEIFESIKQKEGGKVVALDYRHASPAELADFMASVLPNYDRDRVYNADIKKLIQWYNTLVANGYDEFIEPGEIAEVPAATEETAKEEETK